MRQQHVHQDRGRRVLRAKDEFITARCPYGARVVYEGGQETGPIGTYDVETQDDETRMQYTADAQVIQNLDTFAPISGVNITNLDDCMAYSVNPTAVINGACHFVHESYPGALILPPMNECIEKRFLSTMLSGKVYDECYMECRQDGACTHFSVVDDACYATNSSCVGAIPADETTYNGYTWHILTTSAADSVECLTACEDDDECVSFLYENNICYKGPRGRLMGF